MAVENGTPIVTIVGSFLLVFCVTLMLLHGLRSQCFHPGLLSLKHRCPSYSVLRADALPLAADRLTVTHKS